MSRMVSRRIVMGFDWWRLRDMERASLLEMGWLFLL